MIEIFGDFEFDEFLTTRVVGLLWALAQASAVVGVLYAIVEYLHDETILIGVLAGAAAVVASVIWLLVVRIVLEIVVVLFRIYSEIYFGNARALRSQIEDRPSATTAPGSAVETE